MISVCIPTYNGEKYIIEQLESILPQLSVDDEIVISDDSSTDDTIKRIEELNDTRIIILKNNHFKSPIYNLENALNHAKGDLIFLSDQDDIWMPNKVSKTIPFITDNNITMSDATLVDEKLNPISKSLTTWREYRSGFFRNLYKGRYLGCCMAFHRKKLNYILPFPENLPAHDVWIGLLGELNGGVTYIPTPLIKYRRHTENFSTVGSKSKNSIVYMILYRLKFLYLTLFRTFKFIIFR